MLIFFIDSFCSFITMAGCVDSSLVPRNASWMEIIHDRKYVDLIFKLHTESPSRELLRSLVESCPNHPILRILINMYTHRLLPMIQTRDQATSFMIQFLLIIFKPQRWICFRPNRHVRQFSQLFSTTNMMYSVKHDNTCSICLESFHRFDKVVQQSCQHVFHKHCVLEWFQNQLHCCTCPTCRHVVYSL